MGTAASIVGLLMVVGGTCSCIIHKRKYRRTKNITPRGTTRRAWWLYWIPPRIFLTRHEYQRAMDAKTVGEGVITRRNSTYNRLPLCQVLKFRCKKNVMNVNEPSKFIFLKFFDCSLRRIVSTDRSDIPLIKLFC